MVVPIIRTIIYLGPFWGPLFVEAPHLGPESSNLGYLDPLVNSGQSSEDDAGTKQRASGFYRLFEESPRSPLKGSFKGEIDIPGPPK